MIAAMPPMTRLKSEGGGTTSRRDRVHGPVMPNDTGRPERIAASTRTVQVGPLGKGPFPRAPLVGESCRHEIGCDLAEVRDRESGGIEQRVPGDRRVLRFAFGGARHGRQFRQPSGRSRRQSTPCRRWSCGGFTGPTEFSVPHGTRICGLVRYQRRRRQDEPISVNPIDREPSTSGRCSERSRGPA